MNKKVKRPCCCGEKKEPIECSSCEKKENSTQNDKTKVLNNWNRHVVTTYSEAQTPNEKSSKVEIQAKTEESKMGIFFIFKKIWKVFCWIFKKLRNLFLEEQETKTK